MKFRIVLEKESDGFYVVTCPSLPGCISQGRTEGEALENMREAIELHVKTLAEDGIPLIEPVAGQKVKMLSVPL